MIFEGFDDISDLLRSGVYALCYNGKVVYIGKSKVMLVRIYQHRNTWARKKREGGLPPWMKGILFDEVFVRPCPLKMIDQLEQAMIKLYKPKHNVQLKYEERDRSRPTALVVNGKVLSLGGPDSAPKSQEFVRRV